ncbi:MAG: chemotaxis-specific protein-glutamate methyltransferase CheB [Deltaproteobacteria bacterium]|nr:chemotaxis-specific protein-glutamate methyltransferase CheB [Deltaproteobacteria bacterium]
MINTLIVEDSMVARQYLKYILESDENIRVIGIVENGEEAIKFVSETKPDVITMDINMPKMNGLEATRRIMETNPVPIVIVSASYNQKDVEKSFMAMEAGAVAILEKPFGADRPDHSEAIQNLIQTVKLMSEVKVIKRWPRERYSQSVPPAIPSDLNIIGVPPSVKAVAIGASTGGPPVLQTIIAGLRKNFPFPVLVVQHISKGFIEGLVEWLAQTTSHPVHIAANGTVLRPGNIYFAPDDKHMGIEGNKIVLSSAPPENGTRPSVSYLFRSAVSAFGGNLIGVLLTGMGKDGAEELRSMKLQGAATIVQDKESSVVYGMPGEALRLDAQTLVLAPERIPSALESIALKKNGTEENKA